VSHLDNGTVQVLRDVGEQATAILIETSRIVQGLSAGQILDQNRGQAAFYFGEALWALTGGAPWHLVERRLLQVAALWRQAS